jgi:hypothetical protein
MTSAGDWDRRCRLRAGAEGDDGESAGRVVSAANICADGESGQEQSIVVSLYCEVSSGVGHAVLSSVLAICPTSLLFSGLWLECHLTKPFASRA